MKKRKTSWSNVRKKQKKQCLQTTGKSLPEELTIDILSRLPVKQLMKFRCVSKTWLRLLTVDPQFLKLHQQRSSGRNPGILLHHKNSVRNPIIEFYYAEDYTKCDRAIRLKLPFRSYPTYQFKISGICNGLLLITRENPLQYIQNSSFNLYIWNPLTVDHIKLPIFRIPLHRKTQVRYMTSFGLGFDQATNDYKVVRLLLIRKLPNLVYQTQVSVCSLRKASWRTLEVDISYIMSYNDTNSRIMDNGALHWLARKLNSYDTILSFDINTETIREMPFPVLVADNSTALWELGGLLSSFRYRSDRGQDLWVMKEYGVSDSWMKHTIIGGSLVQEGVYLQPVGVVNNGDIIFNIMCSRSNRLILYDPKTNATKELHSVRGKGIDHASIIYTESLVSPKNLPDY